MYIIQQRTNKVLSLIGAIAIFTTLSIGVLSTLQNPSAFAQNSMNATISTTNTPNATGVIDSFRAQGQVSSLASDTLAGRPDSNLSQIWILGGNWEFNVAEGNLTNFVVDIEMTQIDGTAAHKHTIERLNNATGMLMGSVEPLEVDLMTEQPSTKIALVNGNSTMFRGTADLTTNENVQWNDVPVHVTLQNGNIITVNIDPTKTEDHFKGLPVFGTVQSIVDISGREVVKK